MRDVAPRRADAIVLVLREQILCGDLPRGAALREEPLAQRFGTSRGTVRRALAALVAERLAVSEPYRGVRVNASTTSEVVELQQLRCALESEAVRILRQRHPGAHWPTRVLAPAMECLVALRDATAIEVVDPAVVATLHSRLHVAVVEACGNQRLIEQYTPLDTELRLVLMHRHDMMLPRHVLSSHRDYLTQLPRLGASAVRRHMSPLMQE